jgi:hypothetical protein
MTDTIGRPANDAAAAHGFRTRPHPAGAPVAGHTRYVAYCACGGWTSGILAVGAEPGVTLIEAFAEHMEDDDAAAGTDPAAGMRLVAAIDEFRGRHPLSSAPYPPETPRESTRQYVMRCACMKWSSDVLSFDRPAPDAWLAAHEAHHSQARLEFLAHRRVGLPVDDEPTAEWAIDARRRARAAIERVQRDSGGAASAA